MMPDERVLARRYMSCQMVYTRGVAIVVCARRAYVKAQVETWCVQFAVDMPLCIYDAWFPNLRAVLPPTVVLRQTHPTVLPVLSTDAQQGALVSNQQQKALAP